MLFSHNVILQLDEDKQRHPNKIGVSQCEQKFSTQVGGCQPSQTHLQLVCWWPIACWYALIPHFPIGMLRPGHAQHPNYWKKKTWAPSKAPREAALASVISSCSSASHCLMPTQPGMSPLAAHISALLKASARFETVWPYRFIFNTYGRFQAWVSCRFCAPSLFWDPDFWFGIFFLISQPLRNLPLLTTPKLACLLLGPPCLMPMSLSGSHKSIIWNARVSTSTFTPRRNNNNNNKEVCFCVQTPKISQGVWKTEEDLKQL